MTNHPRNTETTRRIPGAGASISVTSFGTGGPALVLLHGIGSRGVSWWPVIGALASRHSVHALDLRGHGDSDKPASGYLPDDYAADLTAVLDHLGLAQPLVMGHSLGGVALLHWGAMNPGRAAAIVLEDVGLRGNKGTGESLREWQSLAEMPVEGAIDHYRSLFPEWSEDDYLRRAKGITATHPRVFAELRENGVDDATVNRIALATRIESPLLMVHGDKAAGGMADEADVLEVVARGRRAAATRILGGNHFLHRDHTEAFLDAVLPFLETHGGPRD